MKIAIVWAYDGSRFTGSQSQLARTASEDALINALGKIGIFSKLQTSGRTDAGVHATAQVSSVEVGGHWQGRLEWLKTCLAKHLPLGISVRYIWAVGGEFGARFSAIWREYRYIIAHTPPNAFLKPFCTYLKTIPDIITLNAALKIFEGEHDFTGFYKTGSGEKTSTRTIYKIYAYQKKVAHTPCTIIKIRANGFLRGQVRLMVANALFAVGEGSDNKLTNNLPSLKNLSNALNNNRPLTKIPAPPNGLFLTKIFYGPKGF